MPDLRLGISELEWLHRHLPKAIDNIFGELELAIADESRDLEMRLTNDENAAKRVLTAVNVELERAHNAGVA